MPDTKSFESKDTLAAYYGISVVELSGIEDNGDVVRKACELIAKKRGYSKDTLKMQDLKRTMLMLLAGNATVDDSCSFEPKFDIENNYIVKAMQFIEMDVEAEYSWGALSKIEADISADTMLIKIGLGIELDYFEEIAFDALIEKARAAKDLEIDFLEEAELYEDISKRKEEKEDTKR